MHLPFFLQQRTPLDSLQRGSLSLGYKDSNLEMTESESVALPFGDSPISNARIIITDPHEKIKPFFYFFTNFFTAEVKSLFPL